MFLCKCKWTTLTHLSLLNSQIQWGDKRHFSKALSQGSFPQLKSLELSREFGEIRDLFKSEWPKLQSLILQNFGNGNEVLAIFEQLYFPNLIELGFIRPWRYLNLSRISNTVPRLERLTVHDLYSPEDQLPHIQFAWELCELDSSHCSSLGGKLYMLLQYRFPSLHTLILSDCELNSEDLTSLARARTKRSLPELRHLDISMNKRCGGHLGSLFDKSCNWDGLVSLNVQQPWAINLHDPEENALWSNDTTILFSKIQSGFLDSLEDLNFSIYSDKYALGDQIKPCKNLKRLSMFLSLSDYILLKKMYISWLPLDQNDTRAENVFLQPLVSMVRQGLLPALRFVSVVLPSIKTSFQHPKLLIDSEKYFLSKFGICLYLQ